MLFRSAAFVLANTSNSAWLAANAALIAATSANGFAQNVSNSLYYTQNGAFSQINALGIVTNTVNTIAVGAAINAKAAFDEANVVYTYMSAAFNQSNNSLGFSQAQVAALNIAVGSAYNTANYAYLTANAAYNTTNSTFGLTNTTFNTTNAVYLLSNSAYNQANVANTVAYAAIPKSNGTATGTLTIVNLFTSGSCSFLGYHTIDQYGGIFRTGVSGYGVRIYPNGPSTQAILQFTDTYQSTQFGSIFANSSTLSIGTDTLNSVTNIRANGSTVGTFSSSGLLVTGQIDVTGDIIAFYSSDINLKENITVIDNALEKVKIGRAHV